jgi:hypothetical protein
MRVQLPPSAPNNFGGNMKNRALRRHHLSRIKERVKNIWLNIYRDNYFKALNDEKLNICVSKHSSTRKKCSCFACGNIRKNFNELTLQEKRALLNSKETE